MLDAKIKIANKEEAKEKAEKEKEAGNKATSKRTSSGSKTNVNPWIKTISSPTVIRSILGILSKMIK